MRSGECAVLSKCVQRFSLLLGNQLLPKLLFSSIVAYALLLAHLAGVSLWGILAPYGRFSRFLRFCVDSVHARYKSSGFQCLISLSLWVHVYIFMGIIRLPQSLVRSQYKPSSAQWFHLVYKVTIEGPK